MKFSNCFQKLVCITSLCQRYSSPTSPSSHLPDPCVPFMAAAHPFKQLDKAVCLVVGDETHGKARRCSRVYKSRDLSHSAIRNNPVKMYLCPISWDASKDTELMTTGFESSQSPGAVFPLCSKLPFSGQSQRTSRDNRQKKLDMSFSKF